MQPVVQMKWKKTAVPEQVLCQAQFDNKVSHFLRTGWTCKPDGEFWK